ncbi:MAG TPA: NAD(P)/FAD-dependent oxidoreductase [Steroidobacteraceae bacterium]|nr:NAD(P)/FAD-dependent oxidoreductase [Steroidobacteraceae bacterium]
MNAAEQDFDVAVIGAGAAGLCAAAELCAAGRSVLLLEARERIGGRVETRHQAGFALPIELGAEFIHGDAPVTRQLLGRAGLLAVDTSGRRAGRRRDGQPVQGGEFEQARRLLQQAEKLSEDQSVEQFLCAQPPSPAQQPLAGFVRMMVEGFDAADPQRASVQAIAAEWGGDSLQGQARPLGGYGALLGALALQLDPARSRLMLGAAVQAVEWGGATVRILVLGGQGEFSVRAASAVIALPVSILQLPAGVAGAVRFDPPLHEKRAALERLAVGPVIKLVLQFRRPFWEQWQDGAFTDAGFLHVPDADFPTLWTSLPFRAPLLTAWVGGPRAQRLQAKSRGELIELALASAQQALDFPGPLQAELVAAHLHDWSADPYARGAYSYIGVDGREAPRLLAQPLAERLFFAGEAADPDSSGTVEAALQSGRRAARALLGGAE